MNSPLSKPQYLVVSRGQWDESASPQDVQGAIDRFYAWYESHLAQGTMLPGSRLASAGKVVARTGITDGPFAEAKELVGGYWFIVADSLEAAAALAAGNPCLAFGLTLEIRPLDAQRAEATAVTNETPPAWRARQAAHRSVNAVDPLSPLPPITPGRYRHYKGGEYEVLGVVRHSETLEPLVLYRALYGEAGLWVRPFSMFLETVDHGGVRQPRFTLSNAGTPSSDTPRPP